jgi:2-phospho-L-lactate guanylyltransferase
MQVVVPFDARDPKTRLAPVLDTDERQQFARAMLEDACAAIEETGQEPTILATAEIDVAWPVRVDDRPLSEAVNAVIAERDDAVAVVMADLALATPDALQRVFEADGDVVLVPGRGGGTNVVLARHSEFRVDYHDLSFRDHCERAQSLDVDPVVIDSFRLSTDVDDPDDLLDVLVHNEGRACSWLDRNGLVYDRSGDVVTIRRCE